VFADASLCHEIRISDFTYTEIATYNLRVDRCKERKLRRAARRELAVIDAEIESLKEEAQDLKAEIKSLENHREYLRNKPWKAYWKEWPRVSLSAFLTVILGGIVGYSSTRFQATGIIYTIIAGLLALASLAVVFSDAGPTDKNIHGGAKPRFLRSVWSKDGLNIAGIAISLVSLFALISNGLFASSESCGCFGGSSLPYSYK